MWRALPVVTLNIALGIAAHAADKPVCKLENQAQLPVTMSGTQPLIAGTINGTEAHFLADSGAFYSMISSAGAEKLQLKPEGSRKVFLLGVGGIEQARVTNVKSLSLVGFRPAVIDDVEFILGGRSHGYGTIGMIGQNIIGQDDSEYDLANGVIRLFKSTGCGNQPLAYWNKSGIVGAIEIEKTTPRSPHFLGTAILDGRKITVMFDSGASRSMISRKAAARVGVNPEGPGVTDNGIASGIGSGWIKTWQGQFKLLDLGGEQIKNVRLIIGDTQFGGMADMLLGADFFLSHRMYVAKEQRKIYFTYNGGRVFDLSATSEQSAQSTSDPPTTATTETDRIAPKDSSEFRRRGAASMGRLDYKSAMADFDQAIELNPNDAENYRQRAIAYLRTKKRDLAMQDFDRAIALIPNNAAWLAERGSLHLEDRNEARATADFDAALKSAVNDSNLALDFAWAYDRERLYDGAIRYFDMWIAEFPSDARLSSALNGRCWVRGKANKQLDLALDDCDRAIKLRRRANYLDSRGFVQLRLGNLDEAIDAYKDALRLQARRSWSLYGLGIATIRKGNKTKGEKYLQSALAIDQTIADEFMKLGFEP